MDSWDYSITPLDTQSKKSFAVLRILFRKKMQAGSSFGDWHQTWRFSLLYLAAVVVLALMAATSRGQAPTPAPTQSEHTCAISARDPQSPYYGLLDSNDRREDKSLLTIAVYNVEFMFSLNYSCTNPAFDCPGDDCDWLTEADATQHMAQIAANIHDINADIYIMPETQDCCVLNRLNQHHLAPLYADDNTPYVEYLLRGVDYTTGQNIGMPFFCLKFKAQTFEKKTKL